FFQAEDGIRDDLVTGVQTCALPILSGGEQQRLAFARLFLHRPDIVVMDEATSALDADSQAMLMGKLAELLPKTAIISVGHRQERSEERRVGKEWRSQWEVLI